MFVFLTKILHENLNVNKLNESAKQRSRRPQLLGMLDTTTFL
jgi:hypothetical protein